jgi:hypothetical protein
LTTGDAPDPEDQPFGDARNGGVNLDMVEKLLNEMAAVG